MRNLFGAVIVLAFASVASAQQCNVQQQSNNQDNAAAIQNQAVILARIEANNERIRAAAQADARSQSSATATARSGRSDAGLVADLLAQNAQLRNQIAAVASARQESRVAVDVGGQSVLVDVNALLPAGGATATAVAGGNDLAGCGPGGCGVRSRAASRTGGGIFPLFRRRASVSRSVAVTRTF